MRGATSIDSTAASNHQKVTMSSHLSAPAALAEIRAAAARDTIAPGHDAPFVIGVVGHDVPVELIEAAGAVSLRLRGNPEWDTSGADHYLGTGLDPATRSLMAGLLAGAFGRLDAIVVSSDSDASQRLFYVLREIHRVDPATTLPPVYLVDILHLPRESTARYNLIRVTEFVDLLRTWTGASFAETAVADAVLAFDRRRALQRNVMQLRACAPAKLTGVDALAVFAAADRMLPGRYEECLEALIADPDSLDEHEGTRVFLTGSAHDRDSVYSVIENAGAVIVGEDHAGGELIAELDVLPMPVVATSLLDALARRYQLGVATSQRTSISARAAHTSAGIARTGAELLLSYIRVMDESPLWDFAAQRAISPVPASVVARQPYGQIDPLDLDRALRAPHDTGVNA